jgi:hypothetical protein
MEDPPLEAEGDGIFLPCGEPSPESGYPDSTVPRDPRDIPVDELALRHFDRGYHSPNTPPGYSTDEDDEVMDNILERRAPPPLLRELSDF